MRRGVGLDSVGEMVMTRLARWSIAVFLCLFGVTRILCDRRGREGKFRQMLLHVLWYGVQAGDRLRYQRYAFSTTGGKKVCPTSE